MACFGCSLMAKLLIWINYSAIVLSLAVLAVIPPEVAAHGGGQDAQGCHVDSRTGQRHCHTSPKPQVLWGEIFKVSDGDTVKLSTGEKVRLAGIDCPELKQPHGHIARGVLRYLVLGRSVQVEVMDTDRYGRIVGRVHVDGENVNRALVADGHCWVYRRYAKDKALYGLEADAKAARRGLWHDPSPVPPWEWRKQR